MHYIDVEQSKIPLDAPVLAIIKEAFAKYGVNKTDFDLQFDSQTGEWDWRGEARGGVRVEYQAG